VRVSVVDAFTDAPFRGNPAGVVQLDESADEHWMQLVAAEMRHAETAFVRSRSDGDYDLRWFTPLVEVDLCGHATLATAHVLASDSSAGADAPLRFHTRSGVLTATAQTDGRITLDFPAEPAEPIDPPADLDAVLGAPSIATYANRMDLLVEVSDESVVRDLQPDIAGIAALRSRGVAVTAAGSDSGVDFVSRFFAPRVGIDEDPVTGSAHCMLGPFWAGRLGRDVLTARQLSARGGTLGVETRGDRVSLRGRAVTVLSGELHAR
jgi:PhzF family phenazine biosynthesis protein